MSRSPPKPKKLKKGGKHVKNAKSEAAPPPKIARKETAVAAVLVEVNPNLQPYTDGVPANVPASVTEVIEDVIKQYSEDQSKVPMDDEIPDLDDLDAYEEFDDVEDPVALSMESQTTADSPEATKLPLAVHAMSLMLCGLTKRWKNIIGFHFTDTTFDPKECAEFYRKAIRESYAAGSKVKALVMDMSGQNLNV